MSDLYLEKSTFMCRSDGFLVFLNLRTDQYLCIDGTAFDRLVSSAPVYADPSPAANPLLADLLEQKVLTTREAQGKPIQSTNVTIPMDDCMGYPLDRSPRITGRHVAAFIRAIAVTTLRLRLLPLRTGVARLMRRRPAPAPATAPSTEERRSGGMRDGEVRDLVEIFNRLRPFAFTSKEHCLFDSFALAEFLSVFGVGLSVVFGVRLRPFGAHCWVQDRDAVLNDSVDHVSCFTPIMVA